MTDFDTVTLGPDDFLVMRPRGDMPTSWLNAIVQSIPERLRDRVLIVDPTAFDVVHVHMVGKVAS